MKLKRTVLFLIFISIVLLPVCAEEQEQKPEIKIEAPLVTTPKWEEFCELGYENAKKTDRNDIFNIFSFVKAERIKKNYWADRRESFEKYLNTCNVLIDDMEKSACYIELRKIEKNKNEDYRKQRQQLVYPNNIINDK